MTQERLIVLSQRYIDGSITPEEAAELHQAITESTEHRDQLRDQVSMHAVIERSFRHSKFFNKRVRAALRDPSQKKGAITRIMERLDPKNPQTPGSPQALGGSGRPAPRIQTIRASTARRSRRPFLLAAAALVVVILVPTLIYSYLRSGADGDEKAWTLSASAVSVAIAKAEPGPAVVRRNGKMLKLQKEHALAAGDVITSTGADKVTVTYPDKTTIMASGELQLTIQPEALSSEAGIGIELTRGEIVADVAPQPAGKPMIVTTPQGRATVVGTKFKLTAGSAQSRLDVAEGKVRFSSAAKPDSVLVEKGQSAVLCAGVPLEAVSGSRDPALWPFSAESPWNQSIGSAAKFAGIVSPRFDPAKGVELIIDEYSIPIYVATPADPLRNFYRTNRASSKQHRVPLNAQPDPSEVKLMNIIDERHHKVYELIGVELEKDGTIHLGENSYFNSLQGPGVYSDNTQHGTRIYGGSSMGGIIRKGELGGGIRHALAAGVVMPALNSATPSGRPYVWPASNAVQEWETEYGKTGNLYLGSLIAIPPSVDIRTIGVGTSGPAFEVARALQDYGAYVIEHSHQASHDLKLYFEPTSSAEIPKGLDAQLATVMKYLKVVTNNSEVNVGGGGTHRRPPAPLIASEFLDRSLDKNER